MTSPRPIGNLPNGVITRATGARVRVTSSAQQSHAHPLPNTDVTEVESIANLQGKTFLSLRLRPCYSRLYNDLSECNYKRASIDAFTIERAPVRLDLHDFLTQFMIFFFVPFSFNLFSFYFDNERSRLKRNIDDSESDRGRIYRVRRVMGHERNIYGLK